MHLVGHSMGGLIAREAVLQRAGGVPVADAARLGAGRLGGERAAALTDVLAVLDPERRGAA